MTENNSNILSNKLKILHLEDLPADAELIDRALKKGKIHFQKLVVDNKEDFEKALKEFSPDIILADHSLPSFDSIGALKMVKDAGIKVPFILVTATISEEFAVEAMKSGAYDYILKDRLQRLPNAISKAAENFRAEKEREQTEEKIKSSERKMAADLVQHNKDLRQFAYIVSHNLRAPVGNIISLSNMLSMELPPEQKDFCLASLLESAKKLETVITDLHHILEVKQEINEKKEKVVFSDLVKDIQASISRLIESENAVFKMDFKEAEGMTTLRSYIYSIFYNLISNSIKFRRKDVHPLIEISSHNMDGKIVLSFKDNGLGIDLKSAGMNVFGLYNRFHSEIAEGRGMGLFMVKTQVEDLEGKISIASEPGKGTTFTIEFEKQDKILSKSLQAI